MTDEALMLAVRGGDLAKLGILFERHHRAVYDFLSRTIGDRTAAEDLVQDVFVRALKYRATFRGEGSFVTWIFRIARNVRIDHFRGRREAEPVSDQILDARQGTAGPAEQFERDRDTLRLKRALLLLRDDKRELIVLARYRGMTHEQIADVLGIEVGAVKVRIHRAMKELRDVYFGLSGSSPCDVRTFRPVSPIS